MRIILDTQAFLWLGADSPLLSKKAKKLFSDAKNDLYLSLASIWEMAIKSSLGKLKFHKPIETFILDKLQENSIQQLGIDFRHVTRVSALPFHHRDPFDRLIISQALEEKMPVLSSDSAFDQYGVERLW
jgi:PIN domain nuclease of toxin-antitoxin system